MAAKKSDMSCARVVQYKASGLDKIYRHNERRNQSYGNENVITEMSRYNIHFKDPGDETYTEIFRRLEAEGVISTRGLREDATLLDEIIIDVNTTYFEDHGGYEYAKMFYEEAYHFIEKKFGADNIEHRGKREVRQRCVPLPPACHGDPCSGQGGQMEQKVQGS